MAHTLNIAQMAQTETSFRTTTPSMPAMTATTAKQVNPVHVHKNTSWSEPPAHCAHVHKSTIQVCKSAESLEKSQAPTQWKDFSEQTAIDKARHSVTLFHLLRRYRTFSRGPVHILP